MYNLTYNDAIKIQEEQLDFYCRNVSQEEGERIRREIKNKTLPCPSDPEEELTIIEINELVPRGWEIERVKFGENYGRD